MSSSRNLPSRLSSQIKFCVLRCFCGREGPRERRQLVTKALRRQALQKPSKMIHVRHPNLAGEGGGLAAVDEEIFQQNFQFEVVLKEPFQ